MAATRIATMTIETAGGVVHHPTVAAVRIGNAMPIGEIGTGIVVTVDKL